MENVFIISDNKNEIVSNLILHSFNLIKHKIDLLDSDKQIDSFVNKIDPNCRAIIIPIDLSPFEKKLIGLKYGMHIRLHNSKVKYLPIIFLSDYDDWQIRDMSRGIDSYNHLDYILNTKSIDVIKYSEISEELELKLNALAPLTKSSYKSDFYNHIKILPLEESGGSHSFANIWGLLRFNAALNLNALIDKKTISRTSELYFKYLTTLLEIKEQSKYESLILNGKDKKILLIDDQAKDGWEEVLKSFFRDSKFEVATNYVDGLELAKDLKWDLILLDLRLDPANEDIDGELINPEDFSGAKLLREIKEFNPGLQVIMLTASNKSWNLKKLLELGANGYYLKESPEFNFSNEQAMENIKNFKSEIEKCFEMVWLKNIFSKLETLEKSDFINNLEDSFKDILYNYLSTSKDLLLLSSRNKEFINKAYLQLFFIIEEFVKLDNIFKENDFKELGKEWYVIIDDNEILVRKSKIYESGIKIESAIQMNSKYVLKAHSYIVKKDPRLDVNYKISSLLIFRYGKSNSSVKNWTNIYTKRNADGVAHSNPEETVSSIDILLLIEFIDYLFNTKIDPTNKEKGLKQKSLNEKAKELLDKFKK